MICRDVLSFELNLEEYHYLYACPIKATMHTFEDQFYFFFIISRLLLFFINNNSFIIIEFNTSSTLIKYTLCLHAKRNIFKIYWN